MPRRHAPSFAAQADALHKTHAAHFDALTSTLATRITIGVLRDAILRTNSQLAAGFAFPDPADLLPDQLDVWSDIDDVGRRIAYVAARPDIAIPAQQSIGKVASIIRGWRFARSRYETFLDTDEIPALVAVAYGVGLVVRRDHPRIAAAWIRDAPAR